MCFQQLIAQARAEEEILGRATKRGDIQGQVIALDALSQAAHELWLKADEKKRELYAKVSARLTRQEGQ